MAVKHLEVVVMPLTASLSFVCLFCVYWLSWDFFLAYVLNPTLCWRLVSCHMLSVSNTTIHLSFFTAHILTFKTACTLHYCHNLTFLLILLPLLSSTLASVSVIFGTGCVFLVYVCHISLTIHSIASVHLVLNDFVLKKRCPRFQPAWNVEAVSFWRKLQTSWWRWRKWDYKGC